MKQPVQSLTVGRRLWNEVLKKTSSWTTPRLRSLQSPVRPEILWCGNWPHALKRYTACHAPPCNSPTPILAGDERKSRSSFQALNTLAKTLTCNSYLLLFAHCCIPQMLCPWRPRIMRQDGQYNLSLFSIIIYACFLSSSKKSLNFLYSFISISAVLLTLNESCSYGFAIENNILSSFGGI